MTNHTKNGKNKQKIKWPLNLINSKQTSISSTVGSVSSSAQQFPNANITGNQQQPSNNVSSQSNNNSEEDQMKPNPPRNVSLTSFEF